MAALGVQSMFLPTPYGSASTEWVKREICLKKEGDLLLKGAFNSQGRDVPRYTELISKFPTVIKAGHSVGNTFTFNMIRVYLPRDLFANQGVKKMADSPDSGKCFCHFFHVTY